MAEAKKEEKKADKAHGKSTFFKSKEYLEAQAWRKKFREDAEGGLQNDRINKFCKEHKYEKGDYSGIILRKRGWIVKPHDYKEVPCPCKPSISTGNSCFDLVLITTILIFLWAFYCLFFWATLEIYASSTNDFLYFGCVMQAINFFVIGLTVVAGYNSACYGCCGPTAADLEMEALEAEKKADEAKSDHRV